MTKSPGRRHRGRELALRVLFELDSLPKDMDQVLRYQGEELGATDDVMAFATALVTSTTTNQAQIDEALSRASDNWDLPDLGKVERAILRLSTAEMLFLHDTPNAVVIDEAVELAKAYAGDEASSYINGVLGKIAREPV